MEITHTRENLQIGQLYYFDSHRSWYGRYVGEKRGKLQFTAEKPGIYKVSRNGYVEFTSGGGGSFIPKEEWLSTEELIKREISSALDKARKEFDPASSKSERIYVNGKIDALWRLYDTILKLEPEK